MFRESFGQCWSRIQKNSNLFAFSETEYKGLQLTFSISNLKGKNLFEVEERDSNYGKEIKSFTNKAVTLNLFELRIFELERFNCTRYFFYKKHVYKKPTCRIFKN